MRPATFATKSSETEGGILPSSKYRDTYAALDPVRFAQKRFDDR